MTYLLASTTILFFLLWRAAQRAAKREREAADKLLAAMTSKSKDGS